MLLNEITKKMNDLMNKALEGLKTSLFKVRTGRASANILDPVRVDYYGTSTPISQLGQVSTPEARLLQIQPFDKTMIAAIEKAILSANIGVTPSNDGNLIRIPFPALTEEKRKERTKEVKKLGEDAKVYLRNIRRDENEVVKKAEKTKQISEDDSKKFQNEIQKITDKFIKQIDELVEKKEKELLTL